jgi:hypothetical protein
MRLLSARQYYGAAAINHKESKKELAAMGTQVSTEFDLNEYSILAATGRYARRLSFLTGAAANPWATMSTTLELLQEILDDVARFRLRKCSTT